MPAGKRQPQGGGRFPSLRGALMVDTTRGSIRVRSWPKPRPGTRHPTNEHWTKWLRAVTYLYRYQPALVQAQMAAATKGTVWMPRDIFISAVRGRAWLLQDEEGHKWHPMAFVQEVSDSLDAIAQLPGEMLFRSSGLWVPVPGGDPGQVLTYVSDDDPPEWQSGGGGINYMSVPIVTGISSMANIAVNSTSYITTRQLDFPWDWDTWTPDQLRLWIWGNATAIGQTVTLQIADRDAPATAITAGDDLVVPLSATYHDSGWLDITNPLTGFQTMSVCLKGSNSTVDLTMLNCVVLFRNN